MSTAGAGNLAAQVLPKWVVIVFGASLAYQILHWVEHAAQAYQHAWLGLSILRSHGIVFFLDLEWNHFVFNTLYWAGLGVVLFGAWRWWRGAARRTNPFAFWGFLIGGLGMQTYHQVEHTMRMIQHLQVGCEPCPGILGWYLDGVWLHFSLNTVVLAFPLLAFVAYGFHRKLLALV